MASRSKPSHAEAVEAIYAAGAQPDRWPATLGLLSDYLGAADGMLAYHSLETRTGGLLTGRMRADIVERYVRGHIDNPYAVRLAHAPPGRPVIANQLVDFARVRRTAFYADILEPQDAQDFVAMAHPQLTGRGCTGGVGFILNGFQVQDREGVRERVTTLAPHLVRAVDLTVEASFHSAEARRAASFLEFMPGAAILVDRRLRIVQANEAAEALLAKGDGLAAMREDGELQLAAATSSETRRLRTAFASAVSIADGEDRGLPIALRVSCVADPRTLVVVVTPLPPPAFPFWAAVDRGARALVQVVDPRASATAQAKLLQQAVGLTPTEAKVAALVAEGLTTPQVADALGLLPSTVRTHLARCFDKTGARSQVSLARLLASIPGSR